ncbi:MAG TPA: hypothetical protein VJ901_12960 [Thermoanaerobaculia bacterium]|nr:hypothetical protein [Thermoanaerobaculia bacterium]
MLNAILALAMFSSTATRTANAPASGITKVVIIGRAGSLDVKGQSGATEIRAKGEAEASSEDVLKKMQLVATRSGSTLTIEAQIPEDSSWLGSSPTMGFEVTVPKGVAVSIKDGSGSLTVKDVGELDIDDGSGSIDIDGVTGNVRISDGSGGIEIEKVNGNVTITDDGSGSLDVKDIHGDFTVQHKGSGQVTYERVSGKVSVPKNR